MNVTVNEVDQHQVTLHIELPAAEAKKGAAAAVKNLANKVNIPGFRKGKAPRMILESYLGKDAVKEEINDVLINKAYNDALNEKDITPVSDPEVKIISEEKGQDFVFEITVTKKPEVKLGEYKGIQAAKEEAEVTDEQVAEELAKMQKSHSKLVVAPEGTEIADEDFAIIDFKGTVDGEAFEGGEGKSYPLQIGSGSFIPGFEDQLKGLKAGDQKDVKITFPEDYFEAKLAGKEAVFAVTINDVKRSEVPAIDDEFAKEVGKFDSLDALKEDIKKRLASQAHFQAVEKFNNDVLKTVVDNAEVDIPAVMVDTKVDQMVDEMSMRLETQNLSLEDYLKYTNSDMDKLKEQYRQPATDNVKMDLVLEAIAKAENIQVQDMDLQAEIFTMAQNFGADPKEVYNIIVKERRVPMLIQSVGRKKAASFVLQNAVDTNAKAEETAEPQVEEVKAEEPEA
ncbi:trigger factor [Megasphaera hominis]|jgi:trigger factor|uniref:Trigger factor n=1 Tax=Megasphaera hominis TaxID=159836 RepID=A0ABR6VGC0_9FIRM|nr:trigger factor [Megasphaera hominis]MBC3536108.1 trigger factor [Megasphaera hominis]